MLQFFHGWRRKAGVVALGLACVFMVMWLRSRAWYDVGEMSVNGHTHRFGSLQGELMWLSYPAAKARPIRWMSGRVTDPGMMLLDSNVSLFRSVAQHSSYAMPSIFGLKQSAIPYWALTIPLTLLSAYLLLVPSRKRPTASQPYA
ncbi:MAG TPA: hypothetical protein VGM98_08730 [Schlesneria sp.]